MIVVDVEKTLQSADTTLSFSVCCTVDEKAFVAICGKSGAGKTTLLRMLAGLLVPDRGHIEVHGEVWYDSEKRICRLPQHRAIGYVFQEYNLFPNMTVWDNIVYGLAKTADQAMLQELIGLTELAPLLDRRPDTLSGGQQQRVAVVRALVKKPAVFLLDEPFSALDADMRGQLQDCIAAVHARFGITTFMVTHDVPEVFKLASVAYVIDRGTITRSGTPHDVFVGQDISGKHTVAGEVVLLEQNDIIWVATVRVGTMFAKVVLTDDEAAHIRCGDTVVVSAKAFQPLVMKTT